MTGITPPREEEDGVRFGRALLLATDRPILETGVEAIVSPANRRGVMGVGVAGLVRSVGGIEIEREAMANAPLVLGRSIATTSGALGEQGVRTIIHAVIADALGSPTREDIVRNATTSALQEADRRRVRSIAFPPLGAGMASIGLTSRMVFAVMIEEIVAHLRRFTSRLERVVLVCRDAREVRELTEVIRDARSLWDQIRA